MPDNSNDLVMAYCPACGERSSSVRMRGGSRLFVACSIHGLLQCSPVVPSADPKSFATMPALAWYLSGAQEYKPEYYSMVIKEPEAGAESAGSPESDIDKA